MKRHVVLGLGVFLCCSCLGSAVFAERLVHRPNIVLCVTDDQGWGDVSYNGLTAIETPNLDAMAREGLRFDRFYAHQECAPTRASVLTGRHPNRVGVFWPGERFRRQEITIAQVVKRAGYVTGHFGKWHLNGVSGPGKVISNDDPFTPLNVGFDQSFSVSNYFETDWIFGHNGKPVVTQVPAGVVDIYPTIVDILQIEVPGQVRPIDGISLVPLFEGRMKERPNPMGFWFYDDVRPGIIDTNSGPSAWNDSRFKLVKSAPDAWELYDMLNDRGETTDIAHKHAQVVDRMKRELEAWQQSVIRSYLGKDYLEGRVIQPPKKKH